MSDPGYKLRNEDWLWMCNSAAYDEPDRVYADVPELYQRLDQMGITIIDESSVARCFECSICGVLRISIALDEIYCDPEKHQAYYDALERIGR